MFCFIVHFSFIVYAFCTIHPTFSLPLRFFFLYSRESPKNVDDRTVTSY